MTSEALKQQLRKRYSPADARALLQTLFGDKPVYFTQPHVLAQEEENVRLARQIGSVTLADGRNLALFDVEVADAVTIAQNRKGLRDAAAQFIDQDIIHGALVFFHNPAQLAYRLTFVARYATFNLETGSFERQETQPKRYSFLLGPDEVATTAARQLLSLVEKPAVSLADLTDAFSVEKINREFFKQYKGYYKQCWQYLAEQYRSVFLGNTPVPDNPKEKEKQDKPVRDFTQKLLGRIVFLHFLQKKGWMGCPVNSESWVGGDKGFMQTLFRRFSDPSRFYSGCLTHLFFQTLNVERPGDGFEVPGLQACRVPFLNGGLFDADPPETWAIDLPESFFQNLFDFFDQYNFTIDENRPDDHEVGIDPEMLGRIFENLLEENREKGVFYTPKAIVQYMCQESLLGYLNEHLTETLEAPQRKAARAALADFIRYGRRGNERDPNNFIFDQAAWIGEVLDRVKICDPAIGSGAFPIGMLQEIFNAKLSLNWTLNRSLERAQVKKRIIQESIYGVDVDHGAVEIARLRFWLALVVDEDEPQPLPNLDYKVMQGNSLLESFEGIGLDKLLKEQDVMYVVENGQMDLFGQVADPQISIAFSPDKKQKLDELLRLFFDPDALRRHNLKKEAVKEQIEGLVLDHIEYNFELTELSLERQMGEQTATLALIRMGPNDSKIQGQQKEKKRVLLTKEIGQLQQQLADVREKKQKLYALAPHNRPYFLWNLFFKDVLDEGGFDIMIGNPPYIQLSKIKSEAVQYQQEGYETFERTGDIYCLFYEKGIELLKPGGVLTYITSNSWLQTQYGESLRRFFVQQTDPQVLLNFADTRLFETAVVEANILITRHATCQYQLRAATIGADYDRQLALAAYVDQAGFTLTNLPTEGWTVGNVEAYLLKNKIEGVGKKLEHWPNAIYRGITTGYNPAFIIEEPKYGELTKEEVNIELIKPTLGGRDLRKYTYTFDQQWLLFIPWHFPLHEDKSIVGSSTLAEKKILEEYPFIYEHLLAFKQDLQQRNQVETGIRYEWYALQRCAASYFHNFNKPKIIWGRISDEPKFAYDEEGHYVLDTLFTMVGESLKYLLAVLNSRAAKWYFDQIATTTGMGTNQWLKYKIEQLPVPEPDPNTEQQLEQLVNKILELKKEKTDANTQPYEAQIDALVFKLYGLSEPEMLYILDQDDRLSSREREMIQNHFRSLERGHFTLLV